MIIHNLIDFSKITIYDLLKGYGDMIKFSKIFDMSQPIFHNCPGWPTYDMTNVQYEALCPRDGFTAEKITFNSHTGTHLDAPFHFFPDGKTIDQMPIDAFQGEAIIVDVSKQIKAKDGITIEMLIPYAELIVEGSIVIINTGWSNKRSFSQEYFHDWPYLTREGAIWLRDKKIKGVGIDGMSMGGWYEGTGRPCHEVLLPEEIWLLEELFIPEELLNYKKCYLMAFPLKLQGFGGAPCRAVAMVD